jgi:hypothetical protein
MPQKRKIQDGMGKYITHFFKFLATFVIIIALSLFLFSFTGS